MRNPPFCISGKRPMSWHHCLQAKKIGWHLRPFGNSATCCQHSAVVTYISHESPRQLLHVSWNAKPILLYYDMFTRTSVVLSMSMPVILKTLEPNKIDHCVADVTFQMVFHAWKVSFEIHRSMFQGDQLESFWYMLGVRLQCWQFDNAKLTSIPR